MENMSRRSVVVYSTILWGAILLYIIGRLFGVPADSGVIFLIVAEICAIIVIIAGKRQ